MARVGAEIGKNKKKVMRGVSAYHPTRVAKTVRVRMGQNSSQKQDLGDVACVYFWSVQENVLAQDLELVVALNLPIVEADVI